MSELEEVAKAYDVYQQQNAQANPFFMKDSHRRAYTLGANWALARLMEKARARFGLKPDEDARYLNISFEDLEEDIKDITEGPAKPS